MRYQFSVPTFIEIVTEADSVEEAIDNIIEADGDYEHLLEAECEGVMVNEAMKNLLNGTQSVSMKYSIHTEDGSFDSLAQMKVEAKKAKEESLYTVDLG